MKHILIKTLGLLICGVLSCTSSLDAQDATLVIDVSQQLGPVNTKILGQVVRGADRKDIFSNQHDAFICNEAEGLWDPATRQPKPNALALLKGIRPAVLRYPGGLITQGHDWEKTIGPVSTRPDFQFGLNEYMTICKAVGAEPQIVFSEYVSSVQDSANMVEYLNMPATKAYPWALKRKADGYAEPYGVKIFELGNETWIKKLVGRGTTPHSPQSYGPYYLAVQKAIKAVDPSVKLGLVLANYGYRRFDDPWNLEMFDLVGKQADFVIVHAYAVSYRGNAQNHEEDRILNSCLAATEQIEDWLVNLNQLILQKTGRQIPIAMTEFNASFVGNSYRFGYAAALHSADFVRVMLKPEHNIMLANYWHYLNGHFAMVQGMDDDKLVSHPAYPLMRLWAQHFAGQLVQTSVKQGPTIESKAFLRTAAARGNSRQASGPVSQDNLFVPVPVKTNVNRKVRFELDSQGVFTFELNGQGKPSYPLFAKINIPEDIRQRDVAEYRVTCEMKYEPAEGSDLPSHIGLGVEDARGWDKTKSAIAMPVVTLSGKWHTVVGEYKPLIDTTSLNLLGRLNIKNQNITGKLTIRNIKVIPYTGGCFPAYQALTSTASKSDDGKTLYVMLMNKHQTDRIAVNLDIKGFTAKSGQYWQVTGPSLAASNSPTLTQVSQTTHGANLTMDQLKRFVCKPLSMTMLELHRR